MYSIDWRQYIPELFGFQHDRFLQLIILFLVYTFWTSEGAISYTLDMNLQYKFEKELSRCALFEMCEACLSPERVAYNSRLPSLLCSKYSSGYLTVMVNATISTVCIATYFSLLPYLLNSWGSKYCYYYIQCLGEAGKFSWIILNL